MPIVCFQNHTFTRVDTGSNLISRTSSIMKKVVHIKPFSSECPTVGSKSGSAFNRRVGVSVGHIKFGRSNISGRASYSKSCGFIMGDLVGFICQTSGCKDFLCRDGTEKKLPLSLRFDCHRAVLRN